MVQISIYHLFLLKNEDRFVTGFLQDIGIGILYLCRTEDYFKLLDEKRALSLCIEEAVKNVFDFDHQKLGAEVLKSWGIPDSMYESIRYRHRYRDISKKLQSASNLLLLSDKMSSVYHGTRSAEKFQGIKWIICKDCGMDEDDLGSIIDSVSNKSVEHLSFLKLTLVI